MLYRLIAYARYIRVLVFYNPMGIKKAWMISYPCLEVVRIPIYVDKKHPRFSVNALLLILHIDYLKISHVSRHVSISSKRFHNFASVAADSPANLNLQN